MMPKQIQFHVEGSAEFDDHKIVSYFFDKTSGLRAFVAIHRSAPNEPAFGATRFWTYSTEVDALADALRLSKLMSYKSAMAGLPYGGAKGVIIANGVKNKKKVLEAYAERINFSGGHFVTGTDVGMEQKDLMAMAKKSKYVVGFMADPAEYTALGVYEGIRVSLEEVFGDSDVANHSFAIQGLGKVGLGLLELLYPKTQHIVVSDINRKRVLAAKKKFKRVTVVRTELIHKQSVDVFAPCALSGAINRKNISELHCKIIAGGANNQLESSWAGNMLHRLGILYAPDYVINAGGLICVVDEYQHKNHDPKRVSKRVSNIGNTLEKIYRRSKLTNISTAVVANEMAENILRRFSK